MTAIISSEILEDNPNVYRVTLDSAPGQAFKTLANLDLLAQEIRVVLAPGRLKEANQYTDKGGEYWVYSVDAGFYSPPDGTEMAIIDSVIAAHDPAGQTSAQIKKAARLAASASLQSFYNEPNPSAVQVRDALKQLILVLGLEGDE